MRFDIAKSLNGDNVVYLARDTGGIVRLRANSLEEIQEAIKEYNERLATQSRETNKVKQVTKEDTSDASPTDETSTTDSPEEETKQEEPVEEPTPVKPTEAETTVDSPNTILEATVPDNEESQKRYLHEQAEEKKKPASKKSFWEKLK